MKKNKKEKTLFGLEMSTGRRVSVVFCSIFAILCLIFHGILGFFEEKTSVKVYYPVSGLTESIFDSQNIVYRKNESFSKEISFSKIPYTIDTVDGPAVKVGKASIVQYQPYYFYYSEIDKNEDMEKALKNELTGVISFSSNSNDTIVSLLAKDSGFINGCDADYFIYEIVVNRGGSILTYYMCLYRLDLNDSIYVSDWDILLGCMTDVYTTESLQALQTLASTNIYTIQYDSELGEILNKEKE